MSELTSPITKKKAETWARKQLALAGYDCTNILPFLSVDSDWRIFLYTSTIRKRDRLVFDPYYFVSSAKVDRFLQEKELTKDYLVRLLRSNIYGLVPGYVPINVLADADAALRQFRDVAMNLAVEKLTQHCTFEFVRDHMRFPGTLPGESLGYFSLLYLNGFEEDVRILIEGVLAKPDESPLLQNIIWRRQEEFVADCRKFHDVVFAGNG